MSLTRQDKKDTNKIDRTQDQGAPPRFDHRDAQLLFSNAGHVEPQLLLQMMLCIALMHDWNLSSKQTGQMHLLDLTHSAGSAKPGCHRQVQHMLLPATCSCLPCANAYKVLLSTTHCHLTHAVVYNTLPSDTCCCLQYSVACHMLLSMMCIMQVHSGRLPLSPGSTLAWLGFSDEALVATYDSEVMPAYSSPLIYSRGHITFVM